MIVMRFDHALPPMPGFFLTALHSFPSESETSMLIRFVRWLSLAVVGLIVTLVSILSGTLFDVIIGLIGSTLARLVLPFVSFGRMSVEPLDAPLRKFNWLGYRHDESGRVEIESTVAGFIGLLIGLVIVVAFSLLIRTAF
jgi:hypothetical protein